MPKSMMNMRRASGFALLGGLAFGLAAFAWATLWPAPSSFHFDARQARSLSALPDGSQATVVYDYEGCFDSNYRKYTFVGGEPIGVLVESSFGHRTRRTTSISRNAAGDLDKTLQLHRASLNLQGDINLTTTIRVVWPDGSTETLSGFVAEKSRAEFDEVLSFYDLVALGSDEG